MNTSDQTDNASSTRFGTRRRWFATEKIKLVRKYLRDDISQVDLAADYMSAPDTSNDLRAPVTIPITFERDRTSIPAPAWIDNLCFRFKLTNRIPAGRTKIYMTNLNQQITTGAGDTMTADSFCGIALMVDGNWFDLTNTTDRLVDNNQLCIVGNLKGIDKSSFLQNVAIDASGTPVRPNDYLRLLQLRNGSADFYIRDHLEVIYFIKPGSVLNQHIFETKIAINADLTVEEQKKLFAEELWTHPASNIKIVFEPDATIDGYLVEQAFSFQNEHISQFADMENPFEIEVLNGVIRKISIAQQLGVKMSGKGELLIASILSDSTEYEDLPAAGKNIINGLIGELIVRLELRIFPGMEKYVQFSPTESTRFTYVGQVGEWLSDHGPKNKTSVSCLLYSQLMTTWNVNTKELKRDQEMKWALEPEETLDSDSDFLMVI